MMTHSDKESIYLEQQVQRQNAAVIVSRCAAKGVFVASLRQAGGVLEKKNRTKTQGVGGGGEVRGEALQ